MENERGVLHGRAGAVVHEGGATSGEVVREGGAEEVAAGGGGVEHGVFFFGEKDEGGSGR